MATLDEIDRALDRLNERYHEAGGLHPDARFVRGGRYGRTYIDVTGGPHYGTGSSEVFSGTRGEVLAFLRGIERLRELGLLSAGIEVR